MKHLAHKLSFLLLISIFYFSFSSNAQTIQVDSIFNSNLEFFPFDQVDSISSLKLSGQISLNSDTSIVRVILKDIDSNLYFVYEAYPLIVDTTSFSITSVCDETCFLDGIQPISILVYSLDATINIQSITYTTQFYSNAENLGYFAKLQNDSIKVQTMNNNILNRGWDWVAGYTNNVTMLYNEKMLKYGEFYNLLGFEYYISGVFRFSSPVQSSNNNSELIDTFDWRDRHGSNINEQGNVYYGGEDGWITPLHGQGECAACVAFGFTAFTEAMTNLYFNTQFLFDGEEIDLSEMDIWCGIDGDCDSGSQVSDARSYLHDFGIINDECFEYLPPCSDSYIPCSNPDIKIKIDYTMPVSRTSFDNYKEKLIEYGPIVQEIDFSTPNFEASHVMLLVSYYIDDETNETVWIYKDSDMGVQGDYRPIIFDDLDRILKSYAVGQGENIGVHQLIGSNFTRECRDFDNDGYFNWGVGFRESSFGDPEIPQDSDDYDPRIGPFDQNYYGVPVAPIIEVSENESVISNNGYYTFYDGGLGHNEQITLTFTISNPGNAQLNLVEPTIFNKNIQLSNTVDFNREQDIIDHKLQMETGSTTFKITFTLNGSVSEEVSTQVTIQTDEPDMDDFSFTLVFADCNQSASTLYIYPGVTYWDGSNNQLNFDNVLVQAGATLIVTGDYAFGSNANLFIERGVELNESKINGGILIIDGGSINAVCNSWPGIDVWGDKTKTQFYDLENSGQAPLYQGLVKVINQGEIINAVAAIETIKYVNNEPDLTTSGGIVYFNDGKITDCQKGVVFYPYKNFYPTISDPQLNWSVFFKSNFLNTNITPDNQIFFNGVDGINVSGCNFENKHPDFDNLFFKVSGIESLNSGFTVTDYDYPYPSEETIKSTFKGFNYGIYARTDGLPASQNYTFINSSVFEDNGRGIYMSTIEYPKIINNEFIVRNKFSIFDENYPEQKMVGLYFDQLTTGYTVEQNNFYSNVYYEKLKDRECFGLVVKNSGEEHNELYNNTFNKLLVGIEAIGTNRDDVSDEGLCIKCNDFSRNLTDVFVTPADNPVGNKEGIAKKQGNEAPAPQPGMPFDPTYAAGNVFSTETELTISNYTNDLSCYAIDYWYHGIVGDYKVIPDPTNPMQPTLHLKLNKDMNVRYNSKETACPPNYGGGGTDVIAAKQMLTDESENVNAYTDTLNILVDGGNTTALNLDVVTSTPSQSMSIRQQLLDESPYLSDTVMSSAIGKENVLSNAMLRDVLVANPQSAKSPDLIGSISNRNVQMPGYMMDEIMQGIGIDGEKDLLVNHLSHHSTSRDKAMKQLMKYYISDTSNIATSRDSIINILQNSQYIKPHYQLVAMHLSNNDSLSAFTELNNIENSFDLNSIEQSEHDLFTNLADIQWELAANPVPQDSSYITELLSIAENYKTAPGIYAQNMLISMGLIEYNEPVYTPQKLKIEPIFSYNTHDDIMDSFLKIFPNPAKDYFTAETKIAYDFTEALIRITTLENKRIKDIPLLKKRNQVIIPLSNYTSGTYLVQLIVDGETCTIKKLIITK